MIFQSFKNLYIQIPRSACIFEQENIGIQAMCLKLPSVPISENIENLRISDLLRMRELLYLQTN